MQTGCEHNTSLWQPSTVAALPAVLYELRNMGFSVAHCVWSFEQLQASHSNDVPCFHMGPVNVHTCPQHCLRALQADPQHARVYGSFPYHRSSSVCLAAIHAGIIADEAGGTVLVEPFYPLTWNNDSSQTIFPHQSAFPTLSNGLLSLPVSAIEAVSVPSPLTSSSWTVRTRGLSGRQRQFAPFSPRAGHAHVSMEIVQGFIAGQQLIVGGHNETHYMNDVQASKTDSPSALHSQKHCYHCC